MTGSLSLGMYVLVRCNGPSARQARHSAASRLQRASAVSISRHVSSAIRDAHLSSIVTSVLHSKCGLRTFDADSNKGSRATLPIRGMLHIGDKHMASISHNTTEELHVLLSAANLSVGLYALRLCFFPRPRRRAATRSGGASSSAHAIGTCSSPIRLLGCRQCECGAMMFTRRCCKAHCTSGLTTCRSTSV